MRRTGRMILLGMLGWLLVSVTAPACPFCTMSGETLLNLAEQSNLIVFGSLKSAKRVEDPNDPAAGSSVLEIETVIKDHPQFKGKTLEISRFFEQEMEGKYKFLVFCDVDKKGHIDPYRGIAVPNDSDIARYIKGALALPKEPATKRLRFFFDYLDNKDTEVSIDAYKEFGNSDYKDVRKIAAEVPSDKIAGWIGDKDTPAFRLGLYAMMLGHSGKTDADKYSKLLVSLLEDPQKKVLSGVDGILTGYVLLKPKEGWEYVLNILRDEKREFSTRYSALRAARFFWEYRDDVISRKELIDAVALLLSQSDIADLAVEDLRKWEAWDKAEQVLGLQKTEAYGLPIVRRSVIRYGLAASAKVPAAREYIAAERKLNPGLVTDAEELLRLEQPTPKPTKDR